MFKTDESINTGFYNIFEEMQVAGGIQRESIHQKHALNIFYVNCPCILLYTNKTSPVHE
jgi:hypothetical protein